MYTQACCNLIIVLAAAVFCNRPKCCCCPPKDNCTDVINCVAEKEAALACELSNVGHKLQKEIKCACTVEDLLKANKCALKEIRHITCCEEALLAKLEEACE